MTTHSALTAICLALVLVWLSASTRAWWIRRRNERQLSDARTDIQMGRGMKTADKFGWIAREFL